MARIAFIGTGIMGCQMARRLLEAGHDLYIYNRSRDKTRSLAEAGAAVMATPGAAAAAAELIFAMVADDAASRAVWLGPDGVLQGAKTPGSIAVECSTLSHDWILELNEKLSSRGLRFADCPVTGGPDGAAAGTLKILAGAEPDTLQAIRPVLLAFAEEIIHFGPVGYGTCYKLIVNLMGAAQAAALAEGLLLADKLGLAPDQVAYALNRSTVASPHVQYLLQRMLEGNHDDVYFSAALRHKDSVYALQLAAKHHLDLSTSKAATALYRQTLARELGHKNSSVIYQILRDLHEREQDAEQN